MGASILALPQLRERWHFCECGTELDRDHNAAINILRLGVRNVLSRKGPTGQPVEAPCLQAGEHFTRVEDDDEEATH